MIVALLIWYLVGWVYAYRFFDTGDRGFATFGAFFYACFFAIVGPLFTLVDLKDKLSRKGAN